MKQVIFYCLFCPVLLFGQTVKILHTFDASGAVATRPVKMGTTLPGTCTSGEMFFDSDAAAGSNLYGCTSTDVWTLLGGGGTPGGSEGDAQFNISGAFAGRSLGWGLQNNGTSLLVDSSVLPGLALTNVFTNTNTFQHQVTISGASAKLDATGATGGTLPIQAGTTPPGSCTALKELFIDTDAAVGSRLLRCNSGGDGWDALDASGSFTPSSTDELTNKTVNAEGTGNIITTVSKIWLAAAGCQNTTASLMWDTPTSNPAVAACVTGTNTQKGVADFADGANTLSMQRMWMLPTDWTGNIDVGFKWLTTATSGDVVWQAATICVADGETDDPAFNTASTVTDTAKGTTNQTNDATISGVTATGCAAGELLHLKILRNPAHASDTLAATARLIGVMVTLRRAQ